MSRPAPEVPVRRRPIPPFGSVDEVKRVVEYPFFLRYLLVVGAVLFAVVFPWALYAYFVRERGGPTTIATVVVVVALAIVVVGSKLMPPVLARRFYDRVMQGGVLCDVYPAGLPDAKAAILIDTRLSDAQAAYVHDVIASWLGRSALDPTVQAQADGLFADGPIRSADEFAGTGARGGFLVARDKDPGTGWRLILPVTNPRDPHRPYSKGVVVQVNTPSPESAGQ